MYGSRFELSDNFRDGFIDSVQVLTSDKTRFTSPRVERSNGDVTVLQKGAYTACEPCKDHPEWPPFWQVKATKIIENQETHTVYYEDAQLLFWGFPVFYMPYFSSPDATVNKQTGLLAPQFVSGANLGYGMSRALFHQSRAELRSARGSDLSVEAGTPRRGRLAPAAVEWRLQHSRDRDRRAAAPRIPRLSLRRGRPAPARLDRNQGQLSAQRHVAVRLERHMVERQVLPQRLPASGHRFRQLTISRTSFRRSICAAKPTRATSTSAPTISRARRRTTTTARCRSPLRRSSTTIASSTFPPTAPTASAAS